METGGAAIGDGGEFDKPPVKAIRAGCSTLDSPDRPSLPEARLHPSASADTFTDFLGPDTASTSGLCSAQAEIGGNGQASTSRAVHRRVVLPAARASVRC
jgi:hypothetical protein